VGIGNLYRKTLKEFFIDSVEKLLFLREVINGSGSFFDRPLESSQATQKMSAAKGF